CGTCHPKESADYIQSIHWIRAKKGVREAPVCNDCHNEHSINPVTSKDPKIAKIESRKLQQKTCVVCHESVAFTERFGTQSGIATLYQDSYHGLAVMRGDPDAAMCVDCHSVHKILPKSHPESSVNDKNVTATCGKCHKGSNPTFAKSYSHVTQSIEAQNVENTVSNIYFWFIIVVIGGMFLHNTLIVIHTIRRKRKRQKGEVTIPRFTKNEVIQHIFLFTSFIVLVITGFALKYSHSWWSNLLLEMGMTEANRQLTHRIAAVIMMTLGLYHIFYLIFTARGRDILKGLVPTWSDVIEARDSILYYLNIKSEKPKYDKNDYTEKAEYWALIWGTLVMGVTGLFLWFPTLVNSWAPIWFIKVSEMIHFYEAILASLAILVWHWFFVIFQPSEYPMSLVWIDGKMTLKHYRHHHDKHFRKIILEWYEFKTGKRSEKLLSNSSKLFIKTIKENNSDPDEVLNKELDNDYELREWLESQIFPEPNEKKEDENKGEEIV
ncbi:MAG: cytochrome b/b6 domain-containing protein, partial [Melioribacteraceae bacterium]